MGEPLQCLPQQALKGPRGERLVLRNSSHSFHYKEQQYRYSFYNKSIASQDAMRFLRDINTQLVDFLDYSEYDSQWGWPAVILMPEEYKLRVGGMSVTGLRQQLENYWGRGGILGAAVEAGYQDIVVYKSKRKVPARLDRVMFSHWVNRECAQWLDYFISENHTLGAVHAWFTAFLGVTRESLPNLAELFTNIARSQDSESEAFMESIHRIKFRMSFNVCIEGHDKVVDGIPSLPSNVSVTTDEKGMQVIHNRIDKIYPRRIWDICANTVIPATWFCGPPCPLTRRHVVGPGGRLGVKPVSHAWVADKDRSLIWTEANQHMWPIPLPRGVLLEDVRGEMIRLGVRYAWVDVLCLRQRAQPTLGTELATPVSREAMEDVPLKIETVKRREQRRLEEWKVDVPTIGAVYSNLGDNSLYEGGPIVIFMSGLGRPFQDEGWDSERHWLRRAWTLQESPILSKCRIAGLPDRCYYGEDGQNNWPWNCKVDHDHTLYSVMDNAASVRDTNSDWIYPYDCVHLDTLLLAMRGRHSSKPIDKVCAIAFPFQKRQQGSFDVKFLIYDPSTPVSVVWERLISSIASTKNKSMTCDEGYRRSKTKQSPTIQLLQSPTIQLLRLFPHPSRHHWFPSWAQLQQYPNVSVQDNDPVMAAGDMDYSLRIVPGRMYHGCSLKLKQPPTSEEKAAYHCSIGSRSVELVATVPGIEVNFDSRTTYVLVDISPDHSLMFRGPCCNKLAGHAHLPMWRKSVIIVCEEVDTFAQLATHSPEILRYRYRLRRITTLEWDCSLGELGRRGQGDYHWLPFKQSLEHITSLVCSAEGGYHNMNPPDVFCDPAAVAGLPRTKNAKYEYLNGKPDLDKCPKYEVYLV